MTDTATQMLIECLGSEPDRSAFLDQAEHITKFAKYFNAYAEQHYGYSVYRKLSVSDTDTIQFEISSVVADFVYRVAWDVYTKKYTLWIEKTERLLGNIWKKFDTPEELVSFYEALELQFEYKED